MTNKFCIYIIFSLLLFSVSCSRVPKSVLSEKKMKNVLYDMQMAEAIVENRHDVYRTKDERQVVYDAVFAKHNITQAEYDSSLIWYGRNMDLYMQIYKIVLKDVNDNITALGDIKTNPLPDDFSTKDSVDIWFLKRCYNFSSTRVFDALTFDIKPNIPYSAGSSYVFGMSVWGISSDMKHKPTIRIRAEQVDTIITIDKELTNDGYFETILKTVSTQQIKRVFGYILMDDADVWYNHIYLNDIKLMKYNYGSTAVTAPQNDSIPSQVSE